LPLYAFEYRWTISSPEAPAIRLAVASKAACIFSLTINLASRRALLPRRISFIILSAMTPFASSANNIKELTISSPVPLHCIAKTKGLKWFRKFNQLPMMKDSPANFLAKRTVKSERSSIPPDRPAWFSDGIFRTIRVLVTIKKDHARDAIRQPLHILITSLVGPAARENVLERPSRDVRSPVAIGGKPDIARTSHSAEIDPNVADMERLC
jgi:hypothetical protein